MKGFILGTILFCAIQGQSSELPWFKVIESGQAQRLKVAPKNPGVTSSSGTVNVRVLLKKFYITQTPEGARVRFETVCEEPASMEVKDLTGGGGIIQERLIVACQSEIKGNSVAVVLSGMVYDNLYGHYSDESRSRARHFMTHLHLHTQDKPILYGLGDFNLGYTRNFPFEHWVAELSTDAAGGRVTIIEDSPTREGFVAAVRYH